ncbi:LOW QUALITY PROTEIN: uncharacterized protein LOC104420546 [Eucalyptus grandis]|uniref:LOW QUALITY PROTEIN: uncharacterized protein LOC104420546 n=1 Tax=Eucalyptus grandis TaxID=71139 RepID=UPI00192EF02E|nr:LOW QUALITY PROTEIN: uncharacterized protein LOC104420546 [Eucalyptus grandis]
MDFWVFVAAAGAGCLTKYLKNTPNGRELPADLCSSCKDPESQKYLVRRLARGKKLARDASNSMERLEFVGRESLDASSAAEEASGSRVYDPKSDGNSEECILSISTLPTEMSSSETYTRNENESDAGCSDCSGSNDMLAGPSEGDIVTYCGFARSKSLNRYKYTRGRLVKPLSSLESCLMAQLYNHHAEMEDYWHGSPQSPTSPIVRPLLVTDGSRIISRLGDGFSGVQSATEVDKLQKKPSQKRTEAWLAYPRYRNSPLCISGSKCKVHQGKTRGREALSECLLGKSFLPEHGSLHGSILFCLGISIGVMSSIIANQKEIEKLKDLLKQTENLVQDLQEELEMKDSLTVKELASENYESQDTHIDSLRDTAPTPFSLEHSVIDRRVCTKESYSPKVEETPDSMSKIEAELEAELERLGLNMNIAGLERRLSSAELEDLGEHFAQGELRTGIDCAQAFAKEDANESSSTSTTHSANYAVSPTELTLRLHEVIQSRLENRIQELELALENSQRKVRLMESAHKSYRSPKTNNHQLASSLHGTPVHGDSNAVARPQPLIMSLAGEALSAYDEACEELMKFDSSEEDSPSGLYEINHQDISKIIKQDEVRDQNAEENGFIQKLTPNGQDESVETLSREEKLTNGHLSRYQEIDSFGMAGDESSDADDEKEKMLIRQIVERTKKGRPVVLKAQTLLFSDDNDD